METVKLMASSGRKHIAPAAMDVDNERDYIARLLNGYKRSIETGLQSYAAGSESEKGYLLEKIENLKSAIEYYL